MNEAMLRKKSTLFVLIYMLSLCIVYSWIADYHRIVTIWLTICISLALASVVFFIMIKIMDIWASRTSETIQVQTQKDIVKYLHDCEDIQFFKTVETTIKAKIEILEQEVSE